jgi:hypothetical protein
MYYTEYGAETKLNSMVDSLPACYSRAHADKLSAIRMTHMVLQTMLELEFHIPSMFGSTQVVHSFFLLETEVGAFLKLAAFCTVFIGTDLR